MTSNITRTLSSASSVISQKPKSIRRGHGRITKEDIRAAALRRWNGRQRITTDWFNIYQESELCFPSGDILVYLRQPGQSSRGPAFRVHSSVLASRGFTSLLQRCTRAPSLPSSQSCLLNACPGCDKHALSVELYIPAPQSDSIDFVFDHHITTRNFFAWLYDIPLSGRALGTSLLNLLGRINEYRNGGDAQATKEEVLSYAESQNYLDFRECVDHALAALKLAEAVQRQDLWTDAFAHVVGLSHRGLNSNIEHESLDSKTKALILESRLEMDVRLARASVSIETFFGDDLSGNFLGLSQVTREHFDRFRTFLHGFYVEKYGFWPPGGFSSEQTRFAIYSSLYLDFLSLYQHLVDLNSSSNAQDHISSGGVCTLQNVEAFDQKHGFQALPNPLPRIPVEPSVSVRAPSLQRRRSWNPVAQRRIDHETKRDLRIQALFDASNRDMALMNCRLVRRYSQFEEKSMKDDLDPVPWIDGRKVRWILVYAILQTLISIMASPKHVRNTEGLSYSLCCQIPKQMPWQEKEEIQGISSPSREIVPDIDYRISNSSTSDVTSVPRSTERKDRRQTLPAQARAVISRTPSLPRVRSLKKLFERKRGGVEPPPLPIPPPSRGFHEIVVHGYGNGLNEVEVHNEKEMTVPSAAQMQRRASMLSERQVVFTTDPEEDEQDDENRDDETEKLPPLTTGNILVSRETSNASTNTSWSNTTRDEVDEITTPTDHGSVVNMLDMLHIGPIPKVATANGMATAVHEEGSAETSFGMDTEAWDAMLGQPSFSY